MKKPNITKENAFIQNHVTIMLHSGHSTNGIIIFFINNSCALVGFYPNNITNEVKILSVPTLYRIPW